MTVAPAGDISDEARAQLVELSSDLARLEVERDSLAALVRSEVVEGLADGYQPEALAEALWGPIPARGDAEGAKERRARLTRIRQHNHQGLKEMGLPSARPAYGGRPSSKPATREREPKPVRPGELARKVQQEPDRLVRMGMAESELRQVIQDYNGVGRRRRQVVMALDDAGVRKEVLAAVLGCSEARISKMSNDARREAGLPVAPQRGGKKAARPPKGR